MRFAAGGIGIDKVSFTLTSINVYGNKAFTEWTKGGVLISKVLSPGNGQMTLILAKGVNRVPNEADPERHAWAIARANDMLRALPAFGLTDPVGCSVVDGKLNIVIPEASKRAKLTRGRNKSTEAAAKTSAVSLPHTPTQSHPTAKPASVTMDRVMNDVERQRMTPEMEIFEETQKLIARLNQLREKIGEDKMGAYPNNGTFRAVFTLS